MPEHEIVVQGDTVLLVERRVLKAVTMESFLTQASNTAIHSTGVLPRNCICFCQKGEQSVIVLESQPRMMTMKTVFGDFYVSLPFLQYFLTLSGTEGNYRVSRCRMSCTKTPVQSMADLLFRSPVPNTGGDGGVCLGKMIFNTGPLPIISRDFLAMFWGSSFNADLGINFKHFAAGEPGIRRVLLEWAKASADDVYFGIAETTRYDPHTGLNMQGALRQCVN